MASVDGLSDKQSKAVELLALGAEYSYIEIAEKCNISTDTLGRWRKDPVFSVAVRKRCRELLKEAEPTLYSAALKAVKDGGSAAHIKILLERLERLEEIADGGARDYQLVFEWKRKAPTEEVEDNEDL